MDNPARKLAVAAIITLLSVGLSTSHAAGRDERHAFDIKRGPLPYVLSQFSRQSGLQVFTQLNASDSKTEELGPVVLEAATYEALEALFRGTDLWFKWQDDATVIIYKETSQQTNWSSGRVTAEEASDSIHGLSGIRYSTGACSEFLVGPYKSDKQISAETFWIELIKPYCSVIYQRHDVAKPGSFDRISAAGRRRYDFSVDVMPRWEALRHIGEQADRLIIGYMATNDAEEAELVGPIRGLMTVNKALAMIMRGTPLRVRWVTDDIASMEPAFKAAAYADMSKCPCNFGFTELQPLESRSVTVEGSRLASLDELVTAPVFIGDSDWIAATGATTIPQLFQYLPQFSFHHSNNRRLSGAQFFEGRGFGADYTLVLVNGRRAFGSAADPMVSAFDLNSIPLPSVDRIEISFDSPSPMHGMDAIGGTVNIVLKQRVDGISADAFLGGAEGGATQRRGTLSGGYNWGRIQGGAVIDYFTTDELLGADRSRWRDQNFSRYDASDQRSRFAAPPNVRAIRGNLPGFDSPSAAIIPGESGARVDTTTPNLTSLRAFQAIVPASERMNFYGFGSAEIGSNTTFRAETLLGRRQSEFQLMPIVLPGLVWGANHPQNPFHQDVLIDVALTGLPIQTYDTTSDLTRVVAELASSFGSWNLSAFGLKQRDATEFRVEGAPNMVAIMNSLKASDATALPVVSSHPGQGADASAFLAPDRIDNFTTDAQQMGAFLSGPIIGDVKAQAGFEHRRESALFDPQIDTVSREVNSTIATVRMPLAGKRVEASIGARHDSYSDVESVTRPTFGLSWRPRTGININANISKTSRPPSLYELHRRRLSTPSQIFDPLLNALVPVTIFFGGNKELKPTAGSSRSLGITWEQPTRWRASAGLWQLELQDRLSAPSAPILLTTDGKLAHDRVIRDSTGRLVSIDVSYANFGAAMTRGIDVSIERQLDTRIGLFSARLDVTHVFYFRYSELPIPDAPLHDKSGRASLEGTIPTDRAVVELSYSRGRWRGELFGRFHSSVDDYAVAVATPTGRDISSQMLIDVNVSRTFASTQRATLGVQNIFDDSAPFAAGFGDVGYDQSTGDLVGRVAYLQWKASF